MYMKGKIKDNMKVRINLALYYGHKNIELVNDWLCVGNPKAFFTLDNNAQLFLFTNNIKSVIFW